MSVGAVVDILQVAVFSIILRGANLGTLVSADVLQDTLKDPINYYITVELACSEGYPVQEHTIITDDGYLLHLHRIPRGRILPPIPRRRSHYHKLHLKHHPDFDGCVRESANLTSTGPPIVFAHGLLMASDIWLLQGPGKDLAYLLADEGFDVWLVNFRGNYYSKRHLVMKPSDPRFWDFSFHDHGTSDMTAVIDHIIKDTTWPRIGYVGYSMGTTTFFALMSSRPEYNDKIFGFVALAPVAYMKNVYMNPRRKALFGLLRDLAEETRRVGKVHEIFPRIPNFVNFGRNYCSMESRLQDLCYDFAIIFFGYPSKLVLRSIVQRYLTHIPSGTSLKNILHFSQSIRYNSFKFFDYGSAKNLQLYGSPTPPDYPLWKITAPVALFYTKGDVYYDARDVDDLMKVLPNVLEIDVKDKFNHGDYLWAFNSKDVLYPKAIGFFKRMVEQFYHRGGRSPTEFRF